MLILGAFYIVFGLLFFICSIKKSPPRHMDYVQDNDIPGHSSSRYLLFISVTIIFLSILFLYLFF